MCGIFGSFQTRPLNSGFVSLLNEATDKLAHRGPDGRGEYLDTEAGVFLGHRRLKIIDLSEASDQPMVRDKMALAYNGELYNYKGLKARLQGFGRKFRSNGDTEVIFESWCQWGPDCLNLFDGMFAFAFWDGRYGWLAVDPFSEKQLYYAETGSGLIFSSELAVLADFINDKPDIKSNLPEFLTLGYISSPNTIYPSIKRLDPASWLKIENGRIVGRHRYWSPPAPSNQNEKRPKFDATSMDQIHEALVDSVSSRLLSDVPACLFLSSGIDSTLVAAITKNDLGRDVETITISYPRGNTNDESEAAAEIAMTLNLSHRVIPSVDEGEEISPSNLLNLFGQPNGNITITSVIQMAKVAANQGFRVGLTGMGGDEIFFGYGKQAFAYHHRALYNLPESVRRMLGFIARPVACHSKSVQIFEAYMALNDCELVPALKNPWMIPALRQIPDFKSWCHNKYGDAKQPFEYTVALVEMMDTMINSQLPALDVGSMQASMEFRTPFLNRKICELMANWDWGDLMSHGGKWVLKELMARYLPREMMDRKKMGFVFPADRFLAQIETPPENLPFLPQSFSEEIWRNRQEPNWRSLATRTALISEFARSQAN
jgi:asparagine synthase (glutamine-hydrolysing)